MAKFYADIVLHVNLFEADDVEQAREVVDVYIDELAQTRGGLNWEEVDFEVHEEQENN